MLCSAKVRGSVFDDGLQTEPFACFLFHEPLEKGVLVLNPGSVAIPKDGTPHACILLDEDGAEWKTTDGEVFHRIRF